MLSTFGYRTSLTLNAVLIATITGLALHKPDHASTRSTDETSPVGQTREDTVSRSDAPPASVGPAAESPQYLEISSPTDRRRMMVDRLRALGVPNAVVARVAQTDFEVQWDSRFEACGSDMARRAAVQLEMDLNKDTEMRAALGDEGFRQWDQDYMLWEAMSTEVEVTNTEAAAIYDVKKRLQQRRLQLEQARLNGTMDEAAINAAYDHAYAEYHQHLKSVLGGERYARSQQIDDAFTADILRHQLADARPSETQFQELFQLEKEWNQVRSELDRQFEQNASAPEYQQQLQALDAARDREYQRVLGEQAFYQLRKQQDPTYAKLKKFETLWKLDDQQIDFVYDTMHEYEKSVEAYKAQTLALEAGGQRADWDKVGQDLEQFAAQAREDLRQHLGQDSFDRLQRNHVLRFMQIRRRPQP